jgi:hypothetical protein
MEDMPRRPGGLTVLAVCNFVIAGLALVGVLALAAVLAVPEARTQLEQEMGAPVSGLWLGTMLATGALIGTLLIVSGIGYLGRRRVTGRIVGSVYALVDLASTGYDLTVREFDLTTVIGLVYPVLTLFLVNGTFRDDLVR